jgi:protein-S-isoprenylcysteine O-methyltransferase Ste14
MPLGAWLFRYRSYIPPLMLVILVLALIDGRAGRASPGLDRRFLALGLVPTAIGFVIRALVVGTAPRGTSGRGTQKQVAEQLNTSGCYSVVRHPLYLGNFLLWIGLATTTGVWWAPLAVGFAFALCYRPILAYEEQFLSGRFGAAYVEWAGRTRAFWPNVRRWRPPALPFSLKTILRQEYYGVFTVVFFLVILELAANVIDHDGWRVGKAWVMLLVATTVITGILRLLQRHTSVLDVEGR